MDGCSRGNLGMSTTGGIFYGHQGLVLASFDTFLEHNPILLAERLAICKVLKMATQLDFSTLEVESYSAMVVS